MPEETMRDFILRRQPCWPMRDIAKELGVPRITPQHFNDTETIVVVNAKGNEVKEIISPSALKNRKPRRRPGRGPSGPKGGTTRREKLPAVHEEPAVDDAPDEPEVTAAAEDKQESPAKGE